MSIHEYSDYQRKIIQDYYAQLDVIMLGRLQELVSELYMAETESRKKRLWQRVEKAMLRLGVPQAIRQHIMDRKDVEVLALNLEDWLAQAHKGKK